MTALNRTWTKPEIEDFLARERLSYQRIDLPFGLSTPGDRRPEMCDLIFRDVAGKSVLDVGSYLGYFCQEALRRGATSAHGLEVDPEKVRQSHALAEMNGLAPVFTAADIESFELERAYDVVLCLNVMHHLFDPVGALLRLARAARHKLVLEFASINPRDGRKLGLGFVTRRLIARLPVVYVAPGVASAEQRTNAQKYFFTPEAVQNILRHHMKLFSNVQLVPSSFKQRFIVIATRRRIRKLLVVSGPTAAGKTTFLARLRAGTLPAETRAALPRDCEKWPQIDAAGLARAEARALDGSPIDVPELDGLVLEYDILRPLESATHTFDRDQAMDLLDCAEEIHVASLRPEPQQLLRQYEASEDAAKHAGRKRRPLQQWHREMLLAHYRAPDFEASWHARWQSYLASKHASAKLFDVRLPAL